MNCNNLHLNYFESSQYSRLRGAKRDLQVNSINRVTELMQIETWYQASFLDQIYSIVFSSGSVLE